MVEEDSDENVSAAEEKWNCRYSFEALRLCGSIADPLERRTRTEQLTDAVSRDVTYETRKHGRNRDTSRSRSQRHHAPA